jgi:hypothetical protein
MNEAAKLKVPVETEKENDEPVQPDSLAEIALLLREILGMLRKSYKDKGRVRDIDSPWLSMADAARYCGYSVAHFRDLAKKFEIPTKGQHDNRFNANDLDMWMEEPKCFKANTVRTSRRRTGKFKIHDVMQDSTDSDDSIIEGEWVFVASGPWDETE